MKIVLAPNAFKESATATQITAAFKNGILKGNPKTEIVELPLADGGDGLLDSLLTLKKGKRVAIEVIYPHGVMGPCEYGVLEDNTAVIDMALCSGLALVPEKHRNPLKTTSRGLGQTIVHAAKKGCREFIVGIGGSATVDAGAGAARSMGYHFLNASGSPIFDGGQGLGQISSIQTEDVLEEIKASHFKIMCDVNNPLLGPNGSAKTFAPQKGADEEMVEELENYMSIFSEKINTFFKCDFTNMKGAGAAGGVGYLFKSLLNAELQNGSKIICELAEVQKHAEDADLILTGEGSLDDQSAHGKLPGEIGRIGKKMGVPVIGISGILGEGWESLKDKGIVDCYSISGLGIEKEESMNNPFPYLEKITEKLVKEWKE